MTSTTQKSTFGNIIISKCNITTKTFNNCVSFFTCVKNCNVIPIILYFHENLGNIVGLDELDVSTRHLEKEK